PAQRAILDFYAWLRAQRDDSHPVPRGIHFDFLSTNYDYLIETILDNIGVSEQALWNTYRGLTPTMICGQPNTNVVPDYLTVNTLIKINGGFEVVQPQADYHLDYRPRSFAALKADPPEIMLPSR